MNAVKSGTDCKVKGTRSIKQERSPSREFCSLTEWRPTPWFSCLNLTATVTVVLETEPNDHEMIIGVGNKRI